jgi:polygalacturonase
MNLKPAFSIIQSLTCVCLSLLITTALMAEEPPWEQADRIVSRIVVPTFPDRDFPVTDYGAVEGGQVLCTDAFRKAIAACHQAGGGRVLVPAGRYLVGAIHLLSRVNLHVSQDAVLLFSQSPSDYLPVVFTRWEGVECMNYSALIYAFEQENIAVTGTGTLDGQADNAHWWPWKGKTQYGFQKGQPEQSVARNKMFDMGQRGVPVRERIFGDDAYLRPNFIQPYRCKNVLIQGVTVLRSPMWEIHPVLCKNVTVRGVTVNSHGPNNDGCDPESCNGVLIEDCDFDTGDDCIALKSGRNNDGRRVNRPIENVVVRNCRMKDGHGGIVIGSEISGGARNIFAEDCLMDSPNLDRMLRIKTNSIRGGTIEHIYLRNIRVGEVGDAIFRVNFLYEEGDAGPFTPVVRDVHIANVTADKSKYGLYLRGYAHSPVQDITLENCTFKQLDKGNELEHVKAIYFRQVTMNGKPVHSMRDANQLLGARVGDLQRPVPMIHATDLFRPHNDPDDHWDLACVYALAHRGVIDLKGILIDSPPPHKVNFNPDVMAVAQMNDVTGLHVPVAVGSPYPMPARHDTQPQASASDHGGIQMVLDILEASDRPVVINVIGSCRDIAIAANRAPDLFKRKCGGIYLNAGTGSPDKTKAAQLEYNVSLAPHSYAALFDVSCPVFWMPCFEAMRSGKNVMEYGTHYQFRQGEILPDLSNRVQNFFLSMLGRRQDHVWLTTLTGPTDAALLTEFGTKGRHMWCTGGFLHAARLAVTRAGEIIPLEQAGDTAVLSFDPIKVSCSDKGVTQWTHDPASTDRYLFHVRDIGHYQPAMVQAMKTLLYGLP